MSLKHIKEYTDTLPQHLLHSLCSANVKDSDLEHRAEAARAHLELHPFIPAALADQVAEHDGRRERLREPHRGTERAR